MPKGDPFRFTSASEESIQIAILAKVLNGDKNT